MGAGLGVLTHWVACAWIWLGDPERYIGPFGQEAPASLEDCEPGGPCEPGLAGSAWRRRYGLEKEDIAVQYLYALRFATGVSTGSDFEVQPGFYAERLFVIFAMFFSFVVCSSIISKILEMFQKMRQEETEKTELVQAFKEFMVAGGVPLKLQTKVRRYLEFQFKSRKQMGFNREWMFEWLSPWLRKE